MSLSDLFSSVSSSAVIVTLVFLLIQVRQTNRNQRSLMQQGRSALAVDLILRRTEAHLSEAIARGWRADMSVDASQVDAINSWCGALLWSIENSFMQHQAGLLVGPSWDVDVATLRGFLAQPHFRVAWTINRQFTAGAYRDYVDSLMREIKPQKAFDELETWKELMAKELAATA